MYYGIGLEVNVEAITADASNIRPSENPSYSVGDFLAFYPQFGTPSLPVPVVQLYIDLASKSISKARYRTSWPVVMAAFVAHFCTLWLKGMASPEDSAETIASSGDVAGVVTNESVDGVSYSMDVSSVMSGLEGFAAWTSTSFGVQLATFAKLYGKGGMVVR